MGAMTVFGRGKRLAWPEQWRRSRLTAVVQVALLGAAAVFSVGVLLTVPANPGRNLMVAVGTPLFVTMAVVFFVMRLRRPFGSAGIRSEYVEAVGERAVVVPYERWTFTVFVSFWASFVLLGMYFAVANVVIGVAAGFNGEVLFTLVLGVLMVGAAGFFVVEVLRGRLARGSVALTPSGVYHRAWSLEGFFPWSASYGVEPFYAREPMILMAFDSDDGWVRSRSVWRDVHIQYLPDLVVRARWLTVDPVVLLAAMDFYLRNPEQRSELDGNPGVERFRQQNFD